jgi:hypothetical protein
MFCSYLDGLSSRLNDANMDCFNGQFVGGPDGDDSHITLDAPLPHVVRTKLEFCRRCAEEYSIVLNVSKSTCLRYPT